MVWDGIDSQYLHEGVVNTYGQIAWDSGTNTYTIRKRLYANAQFDRFVRPGMAVVRSF